MEVFFIGVLFGWIVSEIAWAFSKKPLAIWGGYCVGLLIVFAFSSSSPILMATAVLSPVGVLLPAGALVMSTRRLGFETKPFSVAELAVCFLAFLIYILMSLGFVVNVDPYRLGYTGLGAGGVAVVLAAVAIWRNYLVLLGAIVLAQLLWVFEIGSTNFFDHLGHFLWIVILPIILLARLLFGKPTV